MNNCSSTLMLQVGLNNSLLPTTWLSALNVYAFILIKSWIISSCPCIISSTCMLPVSLELCMGYEFLSLLWLLVAMATIATTRKSSSSLHSFFEDRSSSSCSDAELNWFILRIDWKTKFGCVPVLDQLFPHHVN